MNTHIVPPRVFELLSLAVLVLAAAPMVRAIGWRGLWASQHTFCLIVSLGLTVYVTLLAVTWYLDPGLLLPFASIAVVAGLFFWWRARPSLGTRRGLPPGKLGMIDSLRSLLDHRYYVDQGRKFGSVFKTSHFHRPVACVTDNALGLDLIRNYEDKLEPPPLAFDRFIPGRFIRYMAEKEHRQYRRALQAIIRPEILDANIDMIRAASKEHLARMREVSRQERGVHPAPFMRDLCLDIFPVIFFGLGPESAELARLQALYRRLGAFGLMHPRCDEIEQILQDIETIICAHARDFEEDKGETPRSFLEALATGGSDTIGDITLRRNLLYVMWTTRGDVAGLLTWVLYFIAQHPRVLESIEVEPAPGRSTSWLAPNSPVDRIVAETLRLEQSEFLYREAREDVRWKGFLIPKGWLVRVCTRDAHQGAPCFPNPERFDPDRFLHRKFGHGEYAPFGMGRHSCLGTQMVFAIAREFLYELKTSYDVQLIERGGRILGGRHWSHWKPDNAFSIRVVTRH